MRDALLIIWLLVDLLWTAFLFGGTAYEVFWRGHSGWWFLLAILLGPSMGGRYLYHALKDRLCTSPISEDE